MHQKGREPPQTLQKATVPLKSVTVTKLNAEFIKAKATQRKIKCYDSKNQKDLETNSNEAAVQLSQTSPGDTAQIVNGLGEGRAAGTGEGAENKGGRFGPEKSTAK